MEQFKYRRAVVITAQEDVTEAQVCVEFDNTNFDYSKLYTDNDIAFFDENGNSLPFWRELWREGENEKSKIWVCVGDLTAETDKTIYVCYGNPDWTQKLDDGEAVFEFFDDFESIDALRYEVLRGNGAIEVQNSAVVLKTQGNKNAWWSSDHDAIMLKTLNFALNKHTIVTKFETIKYADKYAVGLAVLSDLDNAHRWQFYSGTQNYKVIEQNTGALEVFENSDSTARLEIRYSPSAQEYYHNDTLVASRNDSLSYSALAIFLACPEAVDAEVAFDYLFAAKWFEYTLTILDEEEYNVLPPSSPAFVTFTTPAGEAVYVRWSEPDDPDLAYIVVEVNINNQGWLRYQDDGTLGTERDYMKFKKQSGEAEPAGYRNEQHFSIAGLTTGDTVQVRLAAVDTAGNQSDWVYSDVTEVQSAAQHIYIPLTVRISERRNFTVEVEK